MPIPKPNSGEHKDKFLKRCMLDEKMKSEYDTEQRYAVCKSSFLLAGLKISFDYDGTLSTKKGFELAQRLISDGDNLYIISARHSKQGMIGTARRLGISADKVYATGSNSEKIKKVKELKIDKHYDNNTDVIKALGQVGKLI